MRVAPSAEDDMRWVEAQSILDRAPTESAEQRLRRWRRLMVLFVTAMVLLATVAAVVLGVRFHHVFEVEPSDVPTWQAVIGSTIAVAGLLLVGIGGVVALSRNSRLATWPSPLAALTRRQRKEVLAQVRGLKPIEPARVPLARVVAEHLVGQRVFMVPNSGLGISFIGQWIALPTVLRAVLAIGSGLVLAAAWAFVQRDARRARRFLEEHPSS